MLNSSDRIDVVRYQPDDKADWDIFLANARNSYFIFQRDYMEYHADRFRDCSLLFRHNGRLLAIMPANIAGDTLYSHQGLTYGGIISDMGMSAALMLEAFKSLIAFMKREGLRHLVYKPIPYVFYAQPAQEDLYALTLNGAVLSRRDLSSALFIEGGVKYTKGKKSNIARARRHGIEIRKSADYRTFIDMLAAVLETRHGVTPAHTAAEMELLSSRFPDHIHLFGAFAGDTMLAGSVIYDNKPVIHTQYMASTPEGKAAGALDQLINVLLTETYADYRFLSFGISTINQGQTVNFGLVESKEAFGARGMVHDWYEMTLSPDAA
jgi:hypothetical protein